jgi:hypothetical protein
MDERPIPRWVYLVLILFLVVVLLAVEVILDWLLPVPQG